MSSNSTDFIRPNGISDGVLLNTNKDALMAYKKAKKRFSNVASLEKKVEELSSLEKKVDDLTKMVEILLQRQIEK